MGNSRRHILLLEENRDIQNAFATLFRFIDEHVLHVCSTSREAKGLVSRQSIDVALIDLSHGVEMRARLVMLQEWRAQNEVFPVIAITANDYDHLAVEALASGADDFVRKPFNFDELMARIDRQLVRGRSAPPFSTGKAGGIRLPDTSFSFAGAIINPDLKIVFPEGRSVELSAKHVGILREFARNRGSLLKRDDLIHAVWGADANTNSKSLDQYLYVLRKTYRESGIDLYDFVRPANRVGWRIAADDQEGTSDGI